MNKLDLTLKLGCAEVVSCVLDNHNPATWVKEVQYVWSVIETYFTVVHNESTSTHVHLKRVLKDSKKGDLLYAQAVAKAVAFWDPFVLHLIPPARRSSIYAFSNCTHGTKLKLDLVNAGAKGRPYSEIFKTIDKFSSLQDVFEYMGQDKNYAWNFCNLVMPRGGDMKTATGTIEFRRPPASLHCRDVFKWITLGLAFVNGALRTSPEMYKEMASMIVPAFPQVKRSDAVFPAAIAQWSADNWSLFEKWLGGSAQQLKLGDFLPVEKLM